MTRKSFTASIMAHHDRPRDAHVGSDNGRGRTCRHTRAAQHFKQAFKGRPTHADTDRRCTTPVALRGKQGAVHPSSWSRCSRRRLSMESRQTTRKPFTGSHLDHHDGTRSTPSLSPAI